MCALQVLLLAWKTGAKRMGFFTRAEFRRGAAICSIITLRICMHVFQPGTELRSGIAWQPSFDAKRRMPRCTLAVSCVHMTEHTQGRWN